MIPIYRRLRKKMADDNKPMKYMRYAIGEILLVVIGILIALQINTWNENRKIQAQELELLENILSDLQNNKKELNLAISSNIRLGKRLEKIENFIDKDLPYDTELDTAFSTISNWFSPYFSYSAFETLKTKGLNLIQNEDIRKSIVLTFERDLAFLSEDLDQFTWDYARSVSIPLTNKYIRKNLSNRLAQPNDFEQLKENTEFINMLHYLIDDKQNATQIFSHFSTRLDTLIHDVENEILIKK